MCVSLRPSPGQWGADWHSGNAFVFPKPEQGPHTHWTNARRWEKRLALRRSLTHSLARSRASAAKTMQVKTQSRATKDAATEFKTILHQQAPAAVQGSHKYLYVQQDTELLLFQ